MHRLLIGGALATLLLPASAHADAEVRFLNAVPGDEEAGLRIVRGSRTVDTRTVPFAGVSGYARVPAGSVVLRMRPTKDGRPQPLRAGLRDGRSYMAVAVGPMDRPQLKLRPERDGTDEAEAEAEHATSRSQRSALLAALAAFFFAELGDKTQLATLTLATRYPPFGVWLGATLGMSLSAGLALVIGRALGTRLPERPIRIVAAVLFLVVGAVLMVDALRG